jgi:hypothetical protein
MRSQGIESAENINLEALGLLMQKLPKLMHHAVVRKISDSSHL